MSETCKSQIRVVFRWQLHHSTYSTKVVIWEGSCGHEAIGPGNGQAMVVERPLRIFVVEKSVHVEVTGAYSDHGETVTQLEARKDSGRRSSRGYGYRAKRLPGFSGRNVDKTRSIYQRFSRFQNTWSQAVILLNGYL